MRLRLILTLMVVGFQSFDNAFNKLEDHVISDADLEQLCEEDTSRDNWRYSENNPENRTKLKMPESFVARVRSGLGNNQKL